MRRGWAAIAVAFALAAGGVTLTAARPAAAITPPETISPLGRELSFAGCGARETLWFDIYVVVLYLPKSDLSPSTMFSRETPKAVRLYPTYEGPLPERIPESWRRRLENELSAEQMDLVRRFYEQLSTRDIATIAYEPGQGTALMIDGRLLARSNGSSLMDGFLDTWLDPTSEGDDPIELLSHGC